MEDNKDWDIYIQPESPWFELRLKEVWRYKDLIYMFIKRDFVAQYKQTILGPLWFIIQPLITTLTYVIVFGNIANLSTDGQPKLLFYMSGILFWNYFSTSFLRTSETFSANAGIFGKVYFPRLTVPIASVCSSFISFLIQFLLLLIIYAAYILNGLSFEWNWAMLLLPVLMILSAVQALGFGIIISSMTTKYRDLKYLISFGIQLLMYATPVVYPLSAVTDVRLAWILKLNPMTAIIETFRYALLGSGTLNVSLLIYSSVISFVVLLLGMSVFNRVQKNFMDTI
ncbi:ABC transporter permease [Cytophaga hutchinsonii]|uniref:Transport permease protein n=1 Tax=Cytophaga hutchinsonii (strain ATCC 33406 / DSM 1761 / CIP 103989 / NBRC 15051 / NCIMB 9469 / D465) TaxID=269798 RepID=A0A6N4SPC7_CYTH3|nr:ABC transporter permease [Cytophaga hutchinsonii]ABG58130.1 polysaccharide ABC transporter, permease [Cytophaga hutchinsonii ATCC 33406]SFX14230.1 lipopolysaccharide transport system permease protein [Cytophaga hutchinsonii ATCC 33406]